MKPLRALVITALLSTVLVGLARGQTIVEFWHAQDRTQDLIQTFAEEFNTMQDTYKVVPRYVGGYREAAIKLVAAINSGRPPVLFDAELTVFPRLIEEGSLAELTSFTNELPREFIDDLYPALWSYGIVRGGRFGLPWHMSMPVLFYNTNVFERRGVAIPTTWQAFEEAAALLTTRNTQGYLDIAYSLNFEAMVTTRGGSILAPDGKPNFDSPEAIEALDMLQRMAQRRHLVSRNLSQFDQSLIDFARGKVMMSIASQAVLPQGERFAVGFDVGTASLPIDSSGAVPLTGAQLVVLQEASEAERHGAFEFWLYLTRVDSIERWVTASFFLPVRRSAAAQLSPWYQASPDRAAALNQLERAVARPKIGAYAIWQGFLEEAIERVTKGNASPEEALSEAQSLALKSR
jgi:sn-glycerol 3-phosphate transport system substrate-binding protein